MEISAHLETFKVRRNLKVGCRLKEKHKREYSYDNRFKVLHLKKKKKLSWHCFFPFLFFLPFYEAQEPSHMPADKKAALSTHYHWINAAIYCYTSTLVRIQLITVFSAV